MPDHPPTHRDHGHDITVAENGLGKVSVCPCGVMTLTVACVSLRFETGAFQELRALLNRVPLADATTAQAHSLPSNQDHTKVH